MAMPHTGGRYSIVKRLVILSHIERHNCKTEISLFVVVSMGVGVLPSRYRNKVGKSMKEV